MKKKAMVAAILAATTLSATTAFAATNPFKDVPKDHWAYDAVNMLAKDGVLDGYGDGNFNGDKLMNRYEMAEIVSKALEKYDTARPADKGAIKKLSREFAAELKDMDARLTAVEGDVQELKKNQSSFKWYGDARLRYFQNKDQKMHDKSSTKKNTVAENRVRLGIYAEPAKNLSVDGRLKYEDSFWKKDGWGGNRQLKWGTDYDDHNSFHLDKMSLNWTNAGTKLSVGRTEISLGQGLLYWENPVDGFYVSHQFGPKVNVMAGWGDMSAATWFDSSVGAFFANVKVQTSPATQITASMFHTNTTLAQATTKYANETWGLKPDASWEDIGNGTYAVAVKGEDGQTHYVKDSSWTDGKTGKNMMWDVKSQSGFAVDTSDSSLTKTGTEALTDPKTYYNDSDYKLNQYSVGINTQIAPKWNVTAEGVRNNAGVLKHKNGFWSRLTYGHQIWSKANTWQIYGEYFALGGGSVDSSGWQHHLNIAGGNAKDVGFDKDAGTRGWGIGAGYMLARNTNLELTFYKLKPFDKNMANFNNYDDVAFAALTYSF